MKTPPTCTRCGEYEELCICEPVPAVPAIPPGSVKAKIDIESMRGGSDIVRGIARAINARGAPNTFTIGELQVYGSLTMSPKHVGAAGKKLFSPARRSEAQRTIAERFVVTYRDKQFVVEVVR